METHKKEILVKIVCAVCVGITAALFAVIARKPATTYQIEHFPCFETVVVTDYFPLRTGNYWEYVGAARSHVGDDRIVEKKVRILMRVVGVVRGGNATLYRMSGHPSDAAWALNLDDVSKKVVNVPASSYGYLVVANKVFRVPEERLENVKKSLDAGGFLGPESISQDDIEFELPLYRGQVFGALCQLARNDRSYAWHVVDSTLYHASVEETIEVIPRYTLLFLTLPDYTEVSFVPYVGIVSFFYSHHGATVQVDVDLQDYHVHSKQ